MTPFGAKLRALRATRGLTLKAMAAELALSSAYLSALEHGHRGRPGAVLMRQIVGVLNLPWDEAEELERLARLSHPRVAVDTAGLSPSHTLAANLLAERVAELDEATVRKIVRLLE